MALIFSAELTKNALLQTSICFGDFSHWGPNWDLNL